MNCRQARELLSPYIDGELPAAERAQLEDHLEQCEDCRSELGELRALVDVLGSLPEEPLPEGFAEALHGRITRRHRWPRLARLVPGRPSFRPGWVQALAVACLVVFLASSLSAVVGAARWWAASARDRDVSWMLPAAGAVAATGRTAAAGAAGQGTGVLSGAEVASSERTAGLGTLVGAVVAPDVRPRVTAEGTGFTSGEAASPGASRRGEMELQVTDIDRAVASLASLAEQAGGYLQDSTISTQDGRRQAVVVVRVPGERLDGVMQQARGLGRVLGQRVTTRSLTQDWVDAEARLRIMRTQEKALQDMLAAAGNIDEVLRIQYELYRLQGDIESLQARMEYLQEDMEKASLQVLLREVGMAAGMSPLRRAGLAFLGTVRAMEKLGQEAIVYAAQAFPVLMLAGLAWLVYVRFGPGRWHR